jgi:peptidoglycan hydrolase-like protein with peptidoglycan-binding domain
MKKNTMIAIPKSSLLYRLTVLIFTVMIGAFTLVQTSQQTFALDGYKFCAMRGGVCKCQKIGDPPGMFREMENDKCVAQPTPEKTTAAPDNTIGPSLPKTVEAAPKKPSSGLQLFNIKLPNLIPKKEAKYRLCAIRNGQCTCQKVGERSGTLVELDLAHCSPRPTVSEEAKPTPQNNTPTPITADAQTKSPATAKQVAVITPSKNVKSVQTMLNSLGFDAGKADGITGQKTTEAITKFQKAARLPVDGKVSDGLLNRLSDMSPKDISKPVYENKPAAVAKKQTTKAPALKKARTSKKPLVRKKIVAAKKAPVVKKMLKPVPIANNKKVQPPVKAPVTAKAPAAAPFSNPLTGLFDNISAGLSPLTSINSYINCTLRDGQCLCQKQGKRSKDWIVMEQSACATPSRDNGKLQARRPETTRNVAPSNTAAIGKAKTARAPLVLPDLSPSETSEPVTTKVTAPKTKNSTSFFDTISGALKPQAANTTSPKKEIQRLTE